LLAIGIAFHAVKGGSRAPDMEQSGAMFKGRLFLHPPPRREHKDVTTAAKAAWAV